MLPFSIAWRFLKSSKGQSFLIALGIAIGVSVQIFIGSLIQGLQIDLVDTTIGSQPQITISTGDKDQKIGDYETLLSQTAQNFPGVKYVSPVADGPALITINSDNFSILMRGMRFADSDGIYKINDRLVDGTLPVNANEVLIGRQLQEETGLVLGDDISILSG